jgi:hypothetical protein
LSEDPLERPDFSTIRNEVKKLNKTRERQIFRVHVSQLFLLAWTSTL